MPGLPHLSYILLISGLVSPELMGSSYLLARFLYVRLLGLIFLLAFLSLTVQYLGLVGSGGIIPVADLLQALTRDMGAERFWLFPSLAWLNCSDSFLQLLIILGVVSSLVVISGLFEGLGLLVCWILYLSLLSIGSPFMSFQWDSLLLETTFLTFFLVSWKPWAPIWKFPAAVQVDSPPAMIFIWLIRWLLFRFILLCGLVKLLSGDPLWQNLTAVSLHYETQPLPTPVAWYAAQLPVAFHKLSAMGVFIMELVVPFSIFSPRHIRIAGAGLMCGFQILIALTGNYTFFNLLTMALCIWLLDDAFLIRFFPGLTYSQEAKDPTLRWNRFRRLTAYGVVWLLITLSGAILLDMIVDVNFIARPARQMVRLVSSFHLINDYGVFAVMSPNRPEIIVEGSRDGHNWLAYEFKYKLGDLRRPPPWVAPHQPRLDWQMWFAALGSYETNPWFVSFMVRLLEGSPAVLGLLEKDPFSAVPPKYIRALIYDYHFTDAATRERTGHWWRRTLIGTYLPPLSLQGD